MSSIAETRKMMNSKKPEELYKLFEEYLGSELVNGLQYSYTDYVLLVRHIIGYDLNYSEIWNMIFNQPSLRSIEDALVHDMDQIVTGEVDKDNLKVVNKKEPNVTNVTLGGTYGKIETIFEARPFKETCFLLDSLYCYIDIIFNAMYETQARNGFKAYKKESIINDVVSQEEFLMFRNRAGHNRRRKEMENNFKTDKKERIRNFSSYGYSFPVDCKLFSTIGRGGRTEMQTAIPNIFRLFVHANGFSELYRRKELEHFSETVISDIFADAKKLDIKPIEWFMFEKLLGINVVLNLSDTLYLLLSKGKMEGVVKALSLEIRNITKIIFRWPGVYSQYWLVEALKNRQYPAVKYVDGSISTMRSILVDMSIFLEALTENAQMYYFFFQDLYRGIIGTRDILEITEAEDVLRKELIIENYAYIKKTGEVNEIKRNYGKDTDPLRKELYQIIQNEYIVCTKEKYGYKHFGKYLE